MSTQKQCPKCGEKNPAEAVMCWACYTSLSGGTMAPATAGAPAGAIAGTASDSGEKKKVEPKQLAIIGVVLVIALGVGASQMLGGGSGEDPGDVISFPPPANAKAPSEPTSSNVSVAGPVGPPPDMPKNAAPIEKFPYSMVAAPNPRWSAATVAIVPTENDLNEGQAKGLCTLAHRHLKKVKDFKRVEIFVFNDAAAAQEFASYQSEQKGAPIQDYTVPRLMAVWPKAITRYMAEGDKAAYTSPQKNPTTFWRKTLS